MGGWSLKPDFAKVFIRRENPLDLDFRQSKLTLVG